MTDPATRDRSAVRIVGGYAEALLMVAASTLAGLALDPRWGDSAVDLLYLPAVLAAAIVAGLGPALLAAAASALAYNFFFTEPRFTFRIDDPNDVVTVIVLFIVAAVASQLAASVRRQARIARHHAARNATIAGFAGQLLPCAGEGQVLAVGTREIARIFDCNVIWVVGPAWEVSAASAALTLDLTPSDIAAAALAMESGEPAGRGVNRAVPTEWQFHPARRGATIVAALGLARDDGQPPVRSDQLALLDNLLDQLALALERGRLESEAREFDRLRERDRVRSSLLASLGQDLRPPLQGLTKAARELRRSGTADKALVGAIGSEAARMERYLANLLALGPATDHAPLTIGDVAIDLHRRVVTRDAREVRLTPKEFAVLAELAKQPGRVLTHAHLLKAVWGPAQAGQVEYLRVAVRGLRQKLERDASMPELILNQPAVGYRLNTGE